MSYIKLVPDDEFHELIKAFASYCPEFKSKTWNVEVGSELNTLESFRLMLTFIKNTITF